MKLTYIKKAFLAACVAAVPMLATNIHAQTQTGVTWNTGSAAPGLFENTANWGGTVPGPAFKAFFNVPASGPCIVDDTEGHCQLALDGNLSGGTGGTIIVTNGGTLYAGDDVTANELDNWGWTGLGVTGTGEIIVGTGGTMIFDYHMWVGSLSDTGNGTLILNGGVATVTNNPNANWHLGTSDGLGVGFIHMNSGTLILGKWDSGVISSNSLMDITGGTVIITSTGPLGSVNASVAVGRVTAYGGTGVVNVDNGTINPGEITIYATGGSAPPPRQSISSIAYSGGQVTITYNSTVGASYQIQSAPSLARPVSWTAVPGSQTNDVTGTSVSYTFTPGSSPQFYETVSPP